MKLKHELMIKPPTEDEIQKLKDEFEHYISNVSKADLEHYISNVSKADLDSIPVITYDEAHPDTMNLTFDVPMTIPMIQGSFVIDEFEKADPAVEDEDGVLTEHGLKVAQDYAKRWISGSRSFELERKYPDLDMLFYDIRSDSETARAHAAD